jgi:hypothetical protein
VGGSATCRRPAGQDHHPEHPAVQVHMPGRSELSSSWTSRNPPTPDLPVKQGWQRWAACVDRETDLDLLDGDALLHTHSTR